MSIATKNSNIALSIISNIKARILVVEPLLGHMLENYQLLECPATEAGQYKFRLNKFTIYYNPEYVKDARPSESMFAILSIMLHIMFKHYGLRAQEKIPEIWDIATDLVVHSILRNSARYGKTYEKPIPFINFTMPEDTIYAEELDPQFPAEKVYEMLLDKLEQENQGQANESRENQEDDNQENDTIQQKDKTPQGQKPSKGKSADQQLNIKMITQSCDNMDTPGQELSEEISLSEILKNPKKHSIDKHNHEITEEFQTKYDDTIKSSVEKCTLSKNYGTVGGNLSNLFDLEEITQSHIPWYDELSLVLLEHIPGEDISCRRRDPRFMHSNVFIGVSETSEFKNVIFSFDTSASMSDDQLKRCLEQAYFCINSFGNAFKAIILYHDTDIQNNIIDMAETGPDEAKQKIKIATGRGGTDFRPVFAYIEKHYPQNKLLVMFTDTEGPYPKEEPPYQVLTISPFKHQQAPFGRTYNLYR